MGADNEARYPKRDNHFAHRAVRLMFKTCLAQQLGTDPVLLVTCIVHTEDAKRYTGPVTYYNDQLQSLLGFAKWERLNRARQVAIEAGWLHYHNNGKRSPGVYWAKVPADLLKTLDDGPTDEGLYPLEGYREGYKHGYREGYKAGYKQGDREGEPSTLSQIPKNQDPDPNHSSLRSPINFFSLEEEEGERKVALRSQTAGKFDTSTVNWEHVERLAEEVARHVPPRSDADRRAWLKYAVLSQTTFGDEWMLDAVNAVRTANGSAKGRQAHFVGVLRAKAQEQGVDGDALKALMRRIEIPAGVWQSDVLGGAK